MVFSDIKSHELAISGLALPDFYEWYVRHNVSLDFTHLCERALQFNQEELDKDTFLQKLNERLATADLNQVKADVLPFVRNPKELDIWSNDYFMELAKMIRFE